MTTHAGKVLVDEKAILRWLQYDGGRIHHIGRSEDCLAITVIIKHPDMPEVKAGEELLIVNPAYYWEDVYRTSPKMGLRTRLLRFCHRIIS